MSQHSNQCTIICGVLDIATVVSTSVQTGQRPLTVHLFLTFTRLQNIASQARQLQMARARSRTEVRRGKRVNSTVRGILPTILRIPIARTCS